MFAQFNRKWHRFCCARICSFIFSPARNIPPPRYPSPPPPFSDMHWHRVVSNAVPRISLLWLWARVLVHVIVWGLPCGTPAVGCTRLDLPGDHGWQHLLKCGRKGDWVPVFRTPPLLQGAPMAAAGTLRGAGSRTPRCMPQQCQGDHFEACAGSGSSCTARGHTARSAGPASSGQAQQSRAQKQGKGIGPGRPSGSSTGAMAAGVPEQRRSQPPTANRTSLAGILTRHRRFSTGRAEEASSGWRHKRTWRGMPGGAALLPPSDATPPRETKRKTPPAQVMGVRRARAPPSARHVR